MLDLVHDLMQLDKVLAQRLLIANTTVQESRLPTIIPCSELYDLIALGDVEVWEKRFPEHSGAWQ